MTVNVFMDFATLLVLAIMLRFSVWCVREKIRYGLIPVFILTAWFSWVAASEFGLLCWKKLPPQGYQILKKSIAYSFHDTNDWMGVWWFIDSWPTKHAAVAASWRHYDRQHKTNESPVIIIYP